MQKGKECSGDLAKIRPINRTPPSRGKGFIPLTSSFRKAAPMKLSKILS
jgi:hypothetical protein